MDNKVSRDLKFKDKNVLIMGLGINQGGLGAAKFFAHSEANVKITDLNNAEHLKDSLDQLKDFGNIEYVLGEHRFEDFDWADLIVKNPGVPPGNKYIEYALEKGKQIETDISLFLQYVDRTKVVGITGTKGKSTTATLTYQILHKVFGPLPGPPPQKREGNDLQKGSPQDGRENGSERVLLAGNIGKSMLDVIPYVNSDTVVILELSSFQLMIFEQHKLSIHRAVVTNIYPDHLNYHGTMEEYIKAKKLIAQFQSQGDYLFLRRSDEVTNSAEFLNDLKSQVIFSDANWILEQVQNDGIQLPEILQSEHNLENLAQAITIAQSFGVSQDEAIKAVQDFQGVEFRQQLIKTWNGIKIVNDTTATMPDAAILAVKTFPDCILIAGGMDKGLPYEGLAEALDRYPKAIYFIDGSATDKLKELMKNKEKIKGTWDNFEDILEAIKAEIAAPTARNDGRNRLAHDDGRNRLAHDDDMNRLAHDDGRNRLAYDDDMKQPVNNDVIANGVKQSQTIVFSPGGTSFNFFKNEFDRGRKFNAAVEKIFN